MADGNNFSLNLQNLVLEPLLRDGVTTPAGVTLREKTTFTRTDGTTGNVFEGLFPTDLVETVFNGDRGVANDNSPIGRLRRTS